MERRDTRVRPWNPKWFRAKIAKIEAARPANDELSGVGAKLSARDLELIGSGFDAEFYLDKNPDVSKAGVDPLRHYMRHGWKEGRDPSPVFSTRYYLSTNADVREAGINPFVHWVLRGRAEGRPGKAARKPEPHKRPIAPTPTRNNWQPHNGGRRKIQLIHLSFGLVKNLRVNNLARAGSIFAYLADVPGWLEFGLERMIRRIGGSPDEHQQLCALLEVLLLRKDVSLKHLIALKKIVELGVRTGQGERVFREISFLARRKVVPKYSNLDLLADAVPLGPEKARLIAELKYVGQRPFSREEVLHLAGVVTGRMELLPGLADRLFAASGQPEGHRERWLACLKESFAVDNITADWTVYKQLLANRDFASEGIRDGLEDFLDRGAVRSDFESFKSAKGTLFTCFHGGFLNLYCAAFSCGADNGLTLSVADGARFISVRNPKAALYRSVRAIDDGRSILIAADAKVGLSKSAIEVLDTEVRLADGAPFIAYEAKCNTVWLAVERVENRFVPKFVPGPFPRDGEKFAAFRERWFSFYADRINDLIRGHPRNIALRMQWAMLFANKLDWHQLVDIP